MPLTELLFEVEADDTSTEPRGTVSIIRHEDLLSLFEFFRGHPAPGPPQTLERLAIPVERFEAMSIARERGLQLVEHPSREHRALNARLRGALADELAAEIADGRATLNLEPPEGPAPAMLKLEPTNERAAELAVQLDDERQLTLYPGRGLVYFEFWSKDPEELERDVRDLAAACRSGNYAETVREFERSHQGEGRWKTPLGEQRRARLNMLFRRPRPGQNGWSRVVYEPY